MEMNSLNPVVILGGIGKSISITSPLFQVRSMRAKVAGADVGWDLRVDADGRIERSAINSKLEGEF